MAQPEDFSEVHSFIQQCKDSKKTVEEMLESRKKQYGLKKSQYDNMAALSYGLMLSLIHLALGFFATFVVKWPDVAKAYSFDKEGTALESGYINDYFAGISCGNMA
jgi:hypothetical protein